VPQPGAALAYYTVFSLAPLILVLIAKVGLIFRNDPGGCTKRAFLIGCLMSQNADASEASECQARCESLW
jgi:uncharacterized BrkB/YihY/UPF0761 family membrane protein